MIERYSSKEMKKLWSEQNRFDNFLKVELANCEAYCNLGKIPISDLNKIKDKASFNLKRVCEIEQETKHDVIAFTRALSESLGEERKWVHYSLTSTDVVDSAMGLIIKEANDIIEQDIMKLLDVLKERALEFKSTPIMGRTHGMHAEVTSFGLKWCLWYDEIKRNLQRFKNVRKEIEVIKISGAVGNFADVPCEIEEQIASILGLDYAKISTQVLSRDRMANYIMVLALIASALEKIAFEVRNLSRSEVGEVEEYFDAKQKGSSAMPHKRNPIASENICGCARLMRSYVQVALEDNPLWHERDISHSSAERIIVADSTTLLDYMIKRYTKVLSKLTVFPNRMLENINKTNGVVFSSRVLTMLIETGLSREVAYDFIQPLAFKSLNEKIDYQKVLLEGNIEKFITKEQLNECFDLNYYLRNVEKIYQRLDILGE